DREYEPMPYKGKATDLFGFFTTDRMKYNNTEGIREQNKTRYLNRYNLWQRWYGDDGELLPHSERELRPIVYHVNRGYPDDLKDVAHDVADQWNDAFVDVVEALGYEVAEGERVFILCPNNPVEAGDPEPCGEPGTSPRLGDLRYSFMAYIAKYMEYGLLGLGPSNNDPQTGEIISGMGYVYHWNDIAAYRTQEMVELLNGTRHPSSFIDGVDLTEWADQVNGTGRSATRTFGLEANEHFVKNFATRHDGELMPITEADVEKQLEHGFDAFFNERLELMHRDSRLNGERTSPAGRLRTLKDTYIEDLLVSDGLLMATGHQPGTPVTDRDLNAASVLRGGLGKHSMELAKLREQFAEKRNMYLAEMADDALLGIARELAGEDPAEVYDVIRRSIYTAVLAHEVGHALGLMHNFSGSEDVVNYFDDYWKIRDRGDGPVRPRLEQPITQAEIDEKIYHYGYSSVMDYAGRYTLDGYGIGKYDRAALLFGYAGKVEVFRDSGGIDPMLLRDWFERRGELLYFYTTGPSAVHYTELYNQMGELLYNDDNRMLVDVDELFVGRFGERDWSRAVIDGEQYLRVPYLYCSHANYNLGDSCLTRSVGADSYERMKNMLDDLNTWYITRSFPRGRIGVDSWSYISAYYPSIYNRLKRWHDLYGLYAELLPQFYSPRQVEEFFTDPVNGWGGKSWAVKNAFNHLIQTLLMPSVGTYSRATRIDGTQMYQPGGGFGGVSLDVTQARYYSTSWHDGNRECGYMWWECLRHIGFYLDKIMAIEALSDTQTNFVARSTPEDIREWQVGYFNTFGDQVLKINEALMGQDFSRVGPSLNGGQVNFPDYTGELDEVRGDLIDPFATFTIQLYWQVLGQARFPEGYDQSFMENSRIWIRGLGNAAEIDELFLVSFRDPWTGFVYETTNRGGKASAGQAMIERANYLLARTDSCDDEERTETTADDCVEGVTPAQRAAATGELRNYLELIKAIAYINPRFSHGNPYSP
ncbi:MAG: zinc-dependent metalloprotease, partial [Bradymonadaceae bacterium]